jgi:ATP-dependent DNA helicase RecQ
VFICVHLWIDLSGLPSVNAVPDLLTPLRRYWGYSEFRPLQERIVLSLLAGRDACVVMPTGGGKSLCYQLPAAMSQDKTVIVISPLIALMEDQTAQLAQMGIPAALLNSSIPPAQQSRVIKKAREGAYRLLYLSPERLAREDTVEWLRHAPVAFFAIDEAHCISEWGHEFRPDYRQLSRLRTHFPDLPIAAFTASATRRVRHDIIDQLKLREPDKYIASFHRPNLRYVVRQAESAAQMDLLLTALQHYKDGNIIVYAPTINAVESTAALLDASGVPAIPYHGQMRAAERKRNQERWMADEARVMVGTIAFGLGINKASVRAVIHLSLPKSIEQFYQEAGRAGRDGQPADCVLLWLKKDAGLHAYFIGQIQDAAEKERSWQRYHEIRDFVESTSCRHRRICEHFGEKKTWQSCGACDACGYVPEWLAGYSGERRGRRRGSVVKSAGAVQRVLETETRARKAAETSSSDVHPELREFLREWRRETAAAQNIAPFIVMHDTTLDDLCRSRPKSMPQLMRVIGIGELKAKKYGAQILEALKRFQAGERAKPRPESKVNSAAETMRLLREGKSLEEIARARGRQLSTIASTVSDLVERGFVEYQPGWVEAGRRAQIEAACASHGLTALRPLKDALPPDFTWEEIRLVVSHLRRLGENNSASAATP